MEGSLTPEQQALLSAHVDGEVSEAERAQVDALLRRTDAQAYVKQLAALRALVAKHAAARAPAGLREAVLAEAGAPQGRLLAIPRATWTTALAALAAMLVVGTALYFAPALMEPDPQQPAVPVARGNTQALPPKDLEERPGAGESAVFRDLGDNEKQGAKLDGAPEDARTLDNDEVGNSTRGMAPKDAVPGPAPAPPPAAPSADAGGSGMPAPTKKPAGDDGKIEAKGVRSEGGAERRKQTEPERNADDKHDGKTDSKNDEEAPADKRRADDAERETTGRSGDAGKADLARDNEKEKKAESAEGARASEQPGEPAEVVLSLKTDHGLAAQNDVLRVSAMYGTAKLGELPETGMEDVLVEVEETRVAALVTALQKLTGQQQYGKLEVPAGMFKPAATMGAADNSARDVLPEEVRDRFEGKSEPKTGAEKPAAEAAPARKIKLKVRLS